MNTYIWLLETCSLRNIQETMFYVWITVSILLIPKTDLNILNIFVQANFHLACYDITSPRREQRDTTLVEMWVFQMLV